MLNPHNDPLQKGYAKDSESDDFFKDVISEEADVLSRLLDAIHPVNFKAEAFPDYQEKKQRLDEVVSILTNDTTGKLSAQKRKGLDDERQKLFDTLERMKVQHKHILVTTIEKIVETAQSLNLGLCRQHSFIYAYQGTHWEQVSEDDFKKFLENAALKMQVDKFTSKHYEFKDKLFKQFLSDAYLPAPKGTPDTVLINLKNGTFEVGKEGNKLREFNSSDFLTYKLPFEYDANAKAPLFQSFLNDVLPDVKRQMILAEFLGFLFVRNLKMEKVLLLYGTGANGKSVVFEIVSALVGKGNISSYSLSSLTDQNGYYRAMISDKLVNYATEINGLTRTDIFKALASGEQVEARLPYGRPFQIEQYAKLIFNCNELPKEVEATAGYFRRFLIIPFDVTIPEGKQDKKLAEKIIHAELSGVFNWVLEGLERLLKNQRFTESDAVTKSLEDYRKQSDSVAMFMDHHNYQSSIDEWKPTIDLYSEYKEFCKNHGNHPVSHPTFNRRLEGNGIVTAKKNIGKVAFIKSVDIPESANNDSSTSTDIF